MDIYKRFGISTSFLDAITTVTEKKHMDPVDPKQAKGAFKDRKDKDIDNDGDTDKTDKYLHTRRNAITKAMSEKKKGKKDKIDLEPKIDDKGDMRGVQEAERRADVKMVKVRNPDGTMSFRKERPEIKVEQVKPEVEKSFPASGVRKNPPMKGVSTMPKDKEKRGPMPAGSMKEEAEELDELEKSTLGSYVKKRVKQLPSIEIGRQMAEPGRQLRGYEKLKKKVNKGIGRAVDRLAKEEVEEMEEELTPDQINIHKQLAAKHRTIAKSSGGDTRVAHQRAVNLHTGAIKNTWYKKGSTDAMAASRKLGVKEDADLTQEDIDFINELNKVDELDKKTLDKYSTRARFSSNPKHREGALKAMDKIKDKSKNEK